MAVVKIKSTHPETQGDFVLINEEDFNPEKHKLLSEPAEPAEPAEEAEEADPAIEQHKNGKQAK